MTHEAAMNAPIACRGTSCHQGRKPCTTPLRCANFDADEAIAAFKLHRQAMPVTLEDDDTEDDFPLWGTCTLVLSAIAIVLAMGGTAIYFICRAVG